MGKSEVLVALQASLVGELPCGEHLGDPHFRHLWARQITGGFQYGQRAHLPIRLAMKVENDRIVKLFESS